MSEILAICQIVVAGLGRDGRESDIRNRIANRLKALDRPALAILVHELLSIGVRRCIVNRVLGKHQLVPRESEAEYGRLAAGHPIEALIRENSAIRVLADQVLAHLRIPEVIDGQGAVALVHALQQLVDAFDTVDRHYHHVQDVLLPYLERRGLRGLSWNFWAYQHGVRDRLSGLRRILKEEDPRLHARELRSSAAAAVKSIRILIENEECILAPVLVRILGPEDWTRISRDSRQTGACVVPPDEDDEADSCRQTGFFAIDVESPCNGFTSASGGLTRIELSRILSTLPFDLTFVDARGRVKFFNEGAGRIFSRKRSILGRNVLRCHPPKSAKVVDQILKDFRSGHQRIAEFWFRQKERFIYVRYFAVRNSAGEYLGTLEVAQDATRVRALEGERRTRT